jgi:hypothetical protein
MPIKNLDLFHYISVFVIPFWFSSLLQPIQDWSWFPKFWIQYTCENWPFYLILIFRLQTQKFEVHSEGEFSCYSRACDFLLVFKWPFWRHLAYMTWPSQLWHLAFWQFWLSRLALPSLNHCVNTISWALCFWCFSLY